MEKQEAIKTIEKLFYQAGTPNPDDVKNFKEAIQTIKEE